jgi:hypothetical protein
VKLKPEKETPNMPVLPSLPATPLVRAFAKSARAAVLALPVLLPALLPGLAYAEQPLRRSNVPEAIRVPAGNFPFLLGRATGTQHYACQPSSTGYAWTLVAPAATLFDHRGRPIMTHFAGPTWQANDGSAVVGARVADATVSKTAIPWLLLRAVSTTPGPRGGDLLTSTTYIQRVNTTGGLAPASGCDATTAGATVKVPYTADYFFYRSRPDRPKWPTGHER